MRQTERLLTVNLLRGVIVLLSFTLTTTSCDLFRKAETVKAPKKEQPPTDPNVNTQPTKPAGTVLVDTIKWRTDPKATPPISATTPPAAGAPTTPTTGTTTKPTEPSKTAYNMAVLLPFYSTEYKEGQPNPAKAQFALDFYAGAKLAFDSLSRTPYKLTVNTLDSRGDINNVLTRYEVSKADLVLGPVDKEHLAVSIPFSTRNNLPMVSPYVPTGDVEGINPNFIQVKPSLKTHCANIVKHIRSHYNIGQAVLVARSKDNETTRFGYFQEANRLVGGGQIEEWRIEDETNYNVEAYIEKNGVTTFIIPSWNEAFVTSILRKLNASPRRNQVVVYGMPQWMDFDKNLNTIYENLRVHVSSSTFIDGNAPEVRAFKSQFMAKYGKLPNSDSFLGYDCALYFGKMLVQYGQKFPYFLVNEPQSALHTKFQFAPIYNTMTTGDDLNNNIAKYENGYVNILKFQMGAFKLDD
jgi:hypothetical protein